MKIRLAILMAKGELARVGNYSPAAMEQRDTDLIAAEILAAEERGKMSVAGTTVDHEARSEALRWYANPKNWVHTASDCYGSHSAAIDDGGAKARKALGIGDGL